MADKKASSAVEKEEKNNMLIKANDRDKIK